MPIAKRTNKSNNLKKPNPKKKQKKGPTKQPGKKVEKKGMPKRKRTSFATKYGA